MNFKPFAPAIAWGVFIFTLSVWPSKDFPKFDWNDLLSLDKIVHIIFYAFLTHLITKGIQQNRFHKNDANYRLLPTAYCVLIATFSASYGWFLEWFQEIFCQDRTYDLMDGIANTIGAFGAAAVYIVQFWLKRTK